LVLYILFELVQDVFHQQYEGFEGGDKKMHPRCSNEAKNDAGSLKKEVGNPEFVCCFQV